MNKSFSIFFCIALTVLAISCQPGKQKTNQPDPEKELMAVDRKYSDLSSREGMNKAFLAMFDTNGVLLRENSMPVHGIQSIRALLSPRDDSKFTLTWEPVYACSSLSGELGYTYGTHRTVSKATGKQIGEGTYCTIWKKDASGEWKAVLDTGNEGLGKDTVSKAE